MNRILIGLLACFTNLAYTDENMLEDYITKSLEFWHVPGASIAIVKDDKIVLARGFGHTKLDKTEKVNGDTLFPIASLTKSFSSMAASIFAEEKQINLDATIQSLWPAFKLADEYAASHLTLRDCLSMRAGLSGKPAEDSWWSQSHLTEKMLIDDLSKLSFPCGFRGCFDYQNLLYNIIGHVIEINTGKSWEKFVQEHILEKLAMKATTTNHDDFLAVQNKAFPHQWKGDERVEVPFERLDVIAPGAGLSSNANDMANWLKFILGNSYSTMTPQVIVSPDKFFAKDETWLEKVFFPKAHFITYGMGWFIHDYKGIKICQDPGLTDGMNDLMAVVPELNLGIVILNNLEAPFFSHSVLFHVIDHYRNEMTDWDPILLDIRKSH